VVSTWGSRGATLSRAGAVTQRERASARISAAAWGAVALVVAFVALTGWWLSVDRSVPYNDAGQHLFYAFSFHDALTQGLLFRALGYSGFYPPATYVLGAVATVIGGINVATPILAQNVVFVPLLALACYRVGRMLAGPGAGLLAVLFALGTPLIVEQFHVFMLDIPQTTLAAVAVWLVLASERFARIGVAACAGLAIGLGLLTKELAPMYVVGVLACVLVRGSGWRNWRGILSCAVVAVLVGTPWYVQQILTEHGSILVEAAGGGRDVPPAAAPSLVSLANLAWYGWATLNGLLLAPLFAIAAIGVGVAVVRVSRTRELEDPTLELLCGLGGAWLLLTVMPHHDMRYTMGFVIFLSTLGTAWIVRLGKTQRTLAVALLVAAIVVAHMGATLGVGGETLRHLPGNRRALYGEGVPPRGRVIVYTSNNYMVSGPQAHPDVLALFRALRRDGMTSVEWDDQVESWDRWFEDLGLIVFARISNLTVIPEEQRTPTVQPREASLIRARTLGGAGEPCLRLTDGTGVWLNVGEAGGQVLQSYCPRRS
jgi:hypothetical protein